MAPKENDDWQLACGQIRERGARLLASGQWADCSFLPGQDAKPVKAHRLILAMASPVFEAMFYGPMAERDAPIVIPDILPEVFEHLLQYVYTDKVNLTSWCIAMELYYAAQKYMLPHLLDLCTSYLADNLTARNAANIYEFANFIEDKELESESLKIIKEATFLVLRQIDFQSLTVGTVVKIFSLDDMNINSELNLLAAAERYFSGIKDSNKEFDYNPEQGVKPDTSDVDKRMTNGMTADLSRSEVTFRFTVGNFSKLHERVWSPTFHVRGLPWRIVVKPNNENKLQKQISFFLQCNGDSHSFTWSCKARAEMRLVSHRPFSGCGNRSLKALFCSTSNVWGFPDYMAWNDVLDPKKGFIKDDCVTFEVHVNAETPHGLCYASGYTTDRLHITNYDVTDMAVQAVMKKIRFLTLTAKELAEYEPKLPLLSKEDILAIMMNLVSMDTKTTLPAWVSKSRKHSNCWQESAKALKEGAIVLKPVEAGVTVDIRPGEGCWAPVDASGAGPYMLEILGGGLCSPVDVFRLK